MGRKSSGVLDFIRAFNAGYDTVGRVAQDFEMAKVAGEKPTESQGFTAEDGQQLEAIANAKDENGKPYYSLAANPDGSYSVTDNAAPAGGQAAVIARRGVTDFMGERSAGKLSDEQVNKGRQRAMANVLMKHDPLQGIRLNRELTQAEREDKRFSWEEARMGREQKKADQAEADASALRVALAPAGAGMGAQPEARGGPANPASAAAFASSAGQKRVQQPGSVDYLKTVAPRAMEVLISQGKLEEAQRLQGFVASAQGRRYADSWMSGVHRFAIGDQEGALKAMEGLYNEQFDDGNTVRLTAQPDGKNHQVEFFNARGESVGKRVAATSDLLSQAMLALDPVQAASVMVQQQGKRQSEAAVLDRQLELERLRQQGRDDMEDRRDARQVRQLGARQAMPRGELTAAQERANLEIDAARRKVAGLDQAEVLRRTAKTTDTGRENKDFDPSLARAVALAQRRKVGDDADFDEQAVAARPAPAAVDRQDIVKRFSAEAAMKDYRLGKETPNGVEVLNSAGKLVGHYR